MAKTSSVTNSNLLKARFLADLVLIQRETSPISVSIGGIVRQEYIVIRDAAGFVVSAVIGAAKRYGFTYSLVNGSLLLDFHSVEEMSQQDFFN